MRLRFARLGNVELLYISSLPRETGLDSLGRNLFCTNSFRPSAYDQLLELEKSFLGSWLELCLFTEEHYINPK